MGRDGGGQGGWRRLEDGGGWRRLGGGWGGQRKMEEAGGDGEDGGGRGGGEDGEEETEEARTHAWAPGGTISTPRAAQPTLLSEAPAASLQKRQGSACPQHWESTFGEPSRTWPPPLRPTPVLAPRGPEPHLSSPGSYWSRRQAGLGFHQDPQRQELLVAAAQHTPAGGSCSGSSGDHWGPLRLGRSQKLGAVQR